MEDSSNCRTQLASLPGLLCAHKDEFTEVYFWRKEKTHWVLKLQIFSLVQEIVFLPFAQGCVTIYASFAVYCEVQKLWLMPWRERGKTEANASRALGHVLAASSSTPALPQLLPSCYPSAAIQGISMAAFTQLLKGQISSLVSSLSAFSNHSHGFALFILIVLLMIGVVLCLQLS